MGGVSDGQAVSESVTNPAFIFKNADDETTGMIGLKHAGSGADVVDPQQAINDLIASDTSQDSDISTLQGKFHETTGHKHTGVAGDAPSLASDEVPVDVGSAGSAGTSKVLSAKDHIHKGIASIQEAIEAIKIFGDAVFQAGTNVTITRSGNTFIIATAATISTVPTGSRFGFCGLVAPDGYVLGSGNTIGDASSNATERANADTISLFTLLWESYYDSELTMLESDGDPVLRGASAAADFALHYQMSLPDYRGRVVAGRGDMGGSPANRLTVGGCGFDGDLMGAVGGVQTYRLQATESGVPAHSHANTASANNESAHTHGCGSGASYFALTNFVSQVASGTDYAAINNYISATASGSAHTHTITVTNVNNTAAQAALSHQNVQPTIIDTVIIKL